MKQLYTPHTTHLASHYTLYTSPQLEAVAVLTSLERCSLVVLVWVNGVVRDVVWGRVTAQLAVVWADWWWCQPRTPHHRDYYISRGNTKQIGKPRTLHIKTR